jgi:PPOX class probable F420-dependent enzyme
MSTIPEKALDLFTSKVAFAHLGTIMPDGTPQITPVWFDYDGAHIIVNTARGRTKDRNMRRDPRVTIAISDPDNPYRYVQVFGRVVEMTEHDGDAVIDRLAKKYMGVDSYPYRKAEEVRVTVRVAIDKVQIY